MIGMNDLFPQGASVRKEQLRRHLVGPVANVQGFGAKGDGVSDDTRAIQAAIDFVVGQGGGTVYVPPGTYKIMPQRDGSTGPEVNALTIRGDNVRLTGDGRQITRLLFRLSGDRDPSETFDIITLNGQPSVWRGSAIAIEGTDSIDKPRRNIFIENLEIDGGAYPGNTGDRTNPVPTRTGAGWDITHKGIFIVPDLALRDLYFSNLHLHNFRGEIIYGGGTRIDNVVIEGCDLHSTNGDGISVSASQVIRDNHIHDCAHACVENFHGPKEGRYLNNRFSNSSIGINLQTDWDSPSPALITGNTFEECYDNGILMNVENGPSLINGNIFVDCGYAAPPSAAIMLSPAKSHHASVATGIAIKGNSILRQMHDGGFGIHALCDSGSKLCSIAISENFIGSSGPALEKNFRFDAPIAYAFTGKADVSGFSIARNTYFHAHRGVNNTVAASVKSSAAMPLMSGNEAVGLVENAVIVADGKTPIRLHNENPTALAGSSDGKVVTPVLVPGDYAPGQKLILTGDSAKRRLYIPQSSDIYECREGRFLSPGVFLTIECDGKKFFEVEYVDRRAHHYAEIMDGSVIDADGHPTVYLSVSSERRFTAFEGVGHGAQLRLIATTNNVTIVHNDAIQLGAGTDYQMVANEVKLFFRSRDGVLREM